MASSRNGGGGARVAAARVGGVSGRRRRRRDSEPRRFILSVRRTWCAIEQTRFSVRPTCAPRFSDVRGFRSIVDGRPCLPVGPSLNRTVFSRRRNEHTHSHFGRLVFPAIFPVTVFLSFFATVSFRLARNRSSSSSLSPPPPSPRTQTLDNTGEHAAHDPGLVRQMR